jgi:uncharacterized protein YndB with AHSA1/START domain
MSTDTLSLSTVLPATPQQIYDAWLDGDAHSAMTGSRAEIEPRVGGKQRAWDGYIDGEFLDLLPGLRIALAWRTRDFPSEAPFSRVELTLASVEGGTRIALAHTGIPEGQGERYETGWEQFYFAPMRRYFERALKPGVARAAQRPAKRAAKTAAKRPPKRAARSAAKRPSKRAAKRPLERAPRRPTKPTPKRRAKIVAKRPAKKRALPKRARGRKKKK